MPSRRVLMLILDTYTPELGERMMGEGALPALARVRRRSARFRLDHGRALMTGLHGEHMSTGLAPAAAGRHSAVHFDPARYAVWQEGTSLPPFADGLAARSVVFDATYFDLARAPTVEGLVDWGAHDPGAPRMARPPELRAEIEARFGPYPAGEWTYGLSWPSARKTEAMAAALADAVDMRGAVAHWLLGERLPHWQLAIVTVHELHSVSEAMWHGIDPAHPLHALPSAAPSRAAFPTVYRAVDRLVGRLAGAFPDAALLVWCLHGMGPNRADLPSMLLLAEALCRHEFGTGLLDARPEWAEPGAPALLAEDDNWELVMGRALADPARLGAERADPHAGDTPPWPPERAPATPARLDWMPAARYRPLWPEMRAFALPSYLDGRVRINLAGREARGRVSRESYGAACDVVERLLRRCRDTRTGEPVVDAVERCADGDPASLGPSEADLIVRWRGIASGFDHPRLGRIGPVPFRRTGSHTGGLGFAYLADAGIAPGNYGVRSAFDVAPTVLDLLGERPRPDLSGTSLLARAAEPLSV